VNLSINKYSWISVGHLTQVMREKKTSMYLGNLIMNYVSIIDITKKLPSLVTLIASIVLNDSFEVENHIY